MPKFYLNLGYKLKKKALCYSHLNNTVDILDRNIVMDYFRHENHWQSSQKKKNNNKTIYYILLYNKILYICIREYQIFAQDTRRLYKNKYRESTFKHPNNI